MGFVGGLVFERPAQGRSYAQLRSSLEQSGQGIEARLAAKPSSPANIEVVRHIIGIERWGQARLRRLLEQLPLEMDRYRPFRPDDIQDWTALHEKFRATRTGTLEIADRLDRLGTNPTVPHNQYGGFTAKGWLRYLEMHARFESMKPR